jgi:hypothetical protein
MSRIRYVCLSDLHFGASNSLLTHLTTDCTQVDPTQPSPVLKALIACSEALLAADGNSAKPILILNGDAIELALATDEVAGMAFQRFIELIVLQNSESLFDPGIIFIPGNHDHHLWETARETQYVNFINRTPGDLLQAPWHTTSMFSVEYPVPSTLLEALIRCCRPQSKVRVRVVYPNYGLLSKDGRKCVVFSHGHFTESIYTLMSVLRCMVSPGHTMPSTSWDCETENFAWIDFFWSTMGRSGDVGKNVEQIYDKIRDPLAKQELVDTLSASIVERWGRPYWPRWLQAAVVKLVLNELGAKAALRERSRADGPLSEDGRKGLTWYLTTPLIGQICEECEKTGRTKPVEYTFVYGHTHKPFQERLPLQEFVSPLDIYNSGGWVVDAVDPEPPKGGAIVLIDDDLNVVSIRMYNEDIEGKSPQVSVETTDQPAAKKNPFLDYIRALIDPSKSPWVDFTEAVRGSRKAYVANLKLKIRSDE